MQNYWQLVTQLKPTLTLLQDHLTVPSLLIICFSSTQHQAVTNAPKHIWAAQSVTDYTNKHFVCWDACSKTHLKTL